MEDEINRGLGRLGPVGSLETDTDMRPVEFEIRYEHRLGEQHPDALLPIIEKECVGIWISSLDGREIAAGEYYLHVQYSEPIRVSNETGEWRPLPWES